jgi:hypothetical protein
MVTIKRRSQPILLNKFDTQCGRDVCNIVADTGISQELLWTSAEIHNDSMKIFSSVTPLYGRSYYPLLFERGCISTYHL